MFFCLVGIFGVFFWCILFVCLFFNRGGISQNPHLKYPCKYHRKRVGGEGNSALPAKRRDGNMLLKDS